MATNERSSYRIDDLRAPVLNPDQLKALEDAADVSLDLTVDGVLSTAKERTGLSDFGPDDFVERLQLLLEVVAWDGHTKLTQVSALRRIVEKAVNRLLTFDLLKRHPEIHDEQITAPLIVAGLPRSGTTHMLNLIAADSRFQSLPYWEVLRPVPLSAEDTAGADGVDPRWQRAQDSWELLLRMNPYQAAHHPMNPDHISEDGELQMQNFSSYVWEFSLHAPAWRDYYLAHDQTPHYEFEKTMLKILQWQRGESRRWIVKAPQHFEQLRPIMNVFPDAIVVVMHRDPVASLQSIVTQSAYRMRTREKVVDLDYVLGYWTDRYERLLTAYVRDVDLVPEAQRFDCRFSEFVGGDVAMVERIYRAAGLDMTPIARHELSAYMEAHPQGHAGRIAFDLRGDFGADPETLRERFREYMELVAIGAETR